PTDRHPDLVQVALALGPGHQAGAPPAQVDQRDRGLQQDVVDRDLLQLGLQRGPHLGFGGLPPLLAHATTSWAYVSAVSWTAAANTSSRAAPASIIRRWRWAPLSSGSATSMASSERIGAVQSSRRATARAAGSSSPASRSISWPSRPQRIARHRFSSTRRGAGSANGTPSSTSRAACATHATISPASASDSGAVIWASQIRSP